MKSVFVIWRDPKEAMWHPVARLTRSRGRYFLNYTRGASSSNFALFPRMSEIDKTYVSNTLFSFFTNRLIPPNRPEFRKMLEWADMNVADYDELDLLGISGSERKTDEFRIVPMPTQDTSDKYKIRFFVNGINYLDESQFERIDRLQPGEDLEFVYEDSNPYDSMALQVSTDDSISIGYCPKYLNKDVRCLLESDDLDYYFLKVVKINRDAPNQFQVLCEFETKWPAGFKPMVSDEYLPYS